jgi:HD-GYP domain-containing protein (c-di-GMP phosphodiesterase class II)
MESTFPAPPSPAGRIAARLTRAVARHDAVTGRHLRRVNEYAYALARCLGRPPAWCDEIRLCAQLHDVGKLKIDGGILRKRGRLGAEEWAAMQRHPSLGYEMLRDEPALAMAADIARCHHEKWDGSGYPAGLRGEAIPLAARIVALADVYDSLRSERPYKPRLSHEAACAVMLDGDDRFDPAAHFDPDLRALFRRHHGEFDRIWAAFH